MCLRICGKCHKAIRDLGKEAEQLYFYCCNYFCSHEKAPRIEELYLDGIYCPLHILEDLESNDWISTTECSQEGIAIKPLHTDWLGDSQVCKYICRGDHL